MKREKIIINGHQHQFVAGDLIKLPGKDENYRIKKVSFLVDLVKGYQTEIEVVKCSDVGDQPTENGDQATPVPGNMVRGNAEWNY